MQIELLNRQKWQTRVELANAIFDYIEIFHNRQRRHSALGYLTPNQFEIASQLPHSPPEIHTSTGNQAVGQVSESTKVWAVPYSPTLHRPEVSHRSGRPKP